MMYKISKFNLLAKRVMYGSGEGQMMGRWSGEVQVTVMYHVRAKSQKYSQLDIGGRASCLTLSTLTWHV